MTVASQIQILLSLSKIPVVSVSTSEECLSTFSAIQSGLQGSSLFIVGTLFEGGIMTPNPVLLIAVPALSRMPVLLSSMKESLSTFRTN